MQAELGLSTENKGGLNRFPPGMLSPEGWENCPDLTLSTHGSPSRSTYQLEEVPKMLGAFSGS